MTPAFENWFIVFVIVMAASAATQTGILLAMFLGFRQMRRKAEILLDRDLPPLINETRALLADGRRTVATLNTTAEEISSFAKIQTARLDGLFADATERARLQLLRADEIIAATMNRIEETTEKVNQAVNQPLRQVQAVIAGIRTAIDFLAGKRAPRRPGERSTEDEEMFI